MSISRNATFWPAPTVLTIALAFAGGCALLPFGHSEKSRTEAAGQVLNAYDVTGMFKQVAPIINDALDNNLPAAVQPAQRKQLEGVVTQVFDPLVLTQALSRRMLQQADMDHRKGVLAAAAKQLQTKTAAAMIARENKAASDAFAAAFHRFLNKSIKAKDASRLTKVQALAKSMQLVQLQTEFNAGMLRAMLAARNAASPAAYRASQESVQEMVDRARTGLRQRLRQQLPIMLFFAYRKAGDDELDAYSKIQNSSAVRWVNHALPKALSATLTEAAGRLKPRYRAVAGDAAPPDSAPDHHGG